MKNIIIAGPSRSGKTTLARKIHDKYGHYVISIDKLVAAFGNSYPDLGIRLNWDRDKTTSNIAPFIGHYLGLFSSSDGKGQYSYSHGAVSDNMFVLEGAYYDFEKISSVLKEYGMDNMKDHFVLVGLVQGQKDEEDFYNDFRKYDTEDDWTFGLSDDELRSVACDAVSYNKEMLELLTRYDFDIYDTSEDREKIMEQILADISRDD